MKSWSPTLPLSGSSKSFGKQSWFVGARLSKFESTVSLLGTRNLTPAAMLLVMWRKTAPPPPPPPARAASRSGSEGGGQVVGWRRGSKWSQLSQSEYFDHWTPAFAPLSLSLPDHFIDTHTYIQTHHTQSRIFTPFFSPQESVSVSLSVCLSLSLSHTHTEDFSHLLTQTRAHSCLLRHQSMLKIAWPETHLSFPSRAPLLHPLPPPPLPPPPPPHSSALLSTTAQSLQQATVISFSNNKGWAVTFVCIGRYLVISKMHVISC